MRNEKNFDVNEFLSDGTPTESAISTGHIQPSALTTPTALTELPVLSEPPAQSVDTIDSRRTLKQRRSELDEYRRRFMRTPRIEDRKPVFISRQTRDRLDRIVRLLGERGMSVSGLIENLARHHLAAHESDNECWRKL